MKKFIAVVWPHCITAMLTFFAVLLLIYFNVLPIYTQEYQLKLDKVDTILQDTIQSAERVETFILKAQGEAENMITKAQTILLEAKSYRNQLKDKLADIDDYHATIAKGEK